MSSPFTAVTIRRPLYERLLAEKVRQDRSVSAIVTRAIEAALASEASR